MQVRSIAWLDRTLGGAINVRRKQFAYPLKKRCALRLRREAAVTSQHLPATEVDLDSFGRIVNTQGLAPRELQVYGNLLN